MDDQATIGVGFVGAGLVVQSIHLPALATLHDVFRVVGIWDLDSDQARAVAASCDAKAPPTFEDLLADPAVEVVAVCSPAGFHAEHAVAAIEAGKRAVLVEKPLAMTREEAARIADAANAAGTPVLVGAMHVFDPGWLGVMEEARAIGADADIIRSSIILPFNSRFEQWAFEPVEREPQGPPPSSGDRRIGIINGGILQLAIHDLPLVRSLLREPEKLEISAVRTFAPFGYAIAARAGDQFVDLFAMIADHWQPRWELGALGPDAECLVEFTPSFVAAGSASAELTRSGKVTHIPAKTGNGYDGEWRAIAAHLRGEQGAPIPTVKTLVDDLAFALSIVEQATALVTAEGDSA